jgi:hypothetical protein
MAGPSECSTHLLGSGLLGDLRFIFFLVTEFLIGIFLQALLRSRL